MANELRLTFSEHLNELRNRLIWSILAIFIGMCLAWFIREPIFTFLTAPFFKAWRRISTLPDPMLHFANPIEPFVAYLKLSFVGGIFLASPVVLYNLWKFVAPGLYPREKRLVVPFVLSSTILFVGGGLICYALVLPVGFQFFLGFSGDIGNQAALTPTIMMNEYMDISIKLILAFGLIFELPVLLTFLALVGILNYRQLLRFGRWFIVLAFIIAAIITPPDVFSQMCMALPLVALYYLSVLLAYWLGPRPDKAS